jgi:DNA helicase-2/ATP-dependent DNA helicase PcrA
VATNPAGGPGARSPVKHPEFLPAGGLELTAEQRAAVLHGDGALLLFAGPGSGKTRTLTGRIAHLLESGRARPREILALTFTVRATEEMRVRLVGLVGHDAAAAVTVATFHALCARILRTHAAVFGRTSSFSVYDQSDVARIVRDLLVDEPGGGEVAGELAGQTAAEISLAKSRLWTPQTLREREPHDGARLAGVWERVDAELERSNAFEFSDLVTCCERLLREQPAVRDGYRRRYRHILVDEYQDTDPAQAAVLLGLAGPHGCAPGGSLMCVADDDQSIFSFRGATVDNVLSFAEAFPGAPQLVLRRNFRCRPEILQAAVRCIRHNTRRMPKALVATRPRGGSVRVARLANDHVEAHWVTKQIAAAIAGGTDPREILVLSRSLRWTQPLQQALTAAGIAHRVIGARSLWERVEVQDALAHVALIANPHDGAAFRRAIGAPTDREQFRKARVKAPSRGCGVVRQRAVIAFAREARIDLLEACVRVGELPIKAEAAKTALSLFGHELDAVRRELADGGSVAKAVIGALSFRDGPVSAYQQLLEEATDQAVLRDTARVLEDLRSVCRAAQSYERERGEQATLVGFLDQTRVEDRGGLTAEQDDRLTIATIHASKGTEAAEVWLLGCEERRLPSGQAIDAGDLMAIEEERRLFYVAATRAKDRLVVTMSHERTGGVTAGASRFLGEAQV